MFNTNKTLEQKVKASMATSLNSVIVHSIIIIWPSDPCVCICVCVCVCVCVCIYIYIYIYIRLFFFSRTEQHGTSSCLYNHDWFNALTETEKEKWFVFILNQSCRHVGAITRAFRRAHQTHALHSLTKRLKSLLVVKLYDDRTSLD